MNNEKIIALLDEMRANCLKSNGAYNDPKRQDKAEALNYAIHCVKTVEPKKGKWISDSSNKLSEWAVCSACWFGTKRIDDDYNFCPNCGARMEEEDAID